MTRKTNVIRKKIKNLCKKCNGHGGHDLTGEECVACDGDGEVEVITFREVCSTCDGTGEIEYHTSHAWFDTCPSCNGTG